MRRTTCFVSAAGLVALFGLAATSATAQQVYVVSKGQVFFQTAASGSVPDPITPFAFNVEAPTNVALTLPSGTAVSVPPRNGQTGSRLSATFATKAALDAAYPDGTYRLTGTAIPALTFNLGTDTYPTAAPSITNGTWTNGVLVVNPAVATTINFSTNSSYATGGVAGHMSFELSSVINNENVDLQQQIATQSIFGLTAASTPFTSFTIPANSLTNGHVYEGEIDFDALTTLDTTSIPGSGGVALWQKVLRFYVVAQTGTGGSAPATPVLANQVGVAGNSVTFSLPSVTNPNAFVLWYFNGQRIDFNTNKYIINNFPSLTINNVSAADVGSYQVTIVTPTGLVTSNAANLTLGAATAPAFVVQPSTQTLTVAGGTTVALNALATATPLPSYQWQRDGANIPGATSPTLILNGANSGSYRVVVSSGGFAPLTSTATPLNVQAGASPGRLANLSIRTAAGSGAQTLIVGFNVGGANTTGSKAILLRAIGPALTGFGVGGALSDPVLTLTNSSNATVATNNGWLAADATAMSSVGAFPLTIGSKDAAVSASSLAGGGYSALITSQSSATGIALAELYDATPANSFTTSTPRLVNVSARAQVGTGDSILIAGFNISGSTAKTVLIRGIGPTLAGFGVGGALADPVLKVYNSSNALVGSNDDWGGDQQLNNQSGRVGAFTITNSSSKDSMLLLTLPPDSYTAQVSGVSNTTGVALVEIYEVP